MLSSKSAIFKLRKELRSAIKTLTVAEEAMVEVPFFIFYFLFFYSLRSSALLHGFGVGMLTAGVRGLRAKPLQDTGEVCLIQANNACCGPTSNLQVCLSLHVERLEPRHINRS